MSKRLPNAPEAPCKRTGLKASVYRSCGLDGRCATARGRSCVPERATDLSINERGRCGMISLRRRGPGVLAGTPEPGSRCLRDALHTSFEPPAQRACDGRTKLGFRAF